jgi:hypothetical protein
MFKLLCLFAALCQDTTPLAPVVEATEISRPQVIFPMTPVTEEPEMIEVPQPPKKEYPASKVIDQVDFDRLYILESDTELFVFQSMTELLDVTALEGPRTLFGRFSDGGTKYESREIKSKYIYVLTAVTPGKVEVLAVPSGVTDRTLIFRQVLTVGAGPNPPPTPTPTPMPPGPTPGPTPTPSPVPKMGFRVLVVIGENATLSQLAVADSLTVRSWLDTNCEGGKAGWQRWSKKDLLMPAFLVNEEQYWQELVAALRPTLPDVPTIYAMVDNKIHTHSMTTADEAIKFLSGLKK